MPAASAATLSSAAGAASSGLEKRVKEEPKAKQEDLLANHAGARSASTVKEEIKKEANPAVKLEAPSGASGDALAGSHVRGIHLPLEKHCRCPS